MNVKFAKRAAIVVGAATLGVAVVTGAAQADPASTTVHRTLVGVGSDTTQDVVNGLANGTGTGQILDPTPPAGSDGKLIASYDATPQPSTITTRATGTLCTGINRPDGSGAGVNALRADIAAASNCLDFARSSSAPNATGQFTFVPLAIDAVTAAVKTGSTLPTDFTYSATANTNALKAGFDLNRIYNCLDTAGNQLPAGVFPTVNGVTVHPLLPQAGSGTRKFWAGKLGFSPNAPLPSCVSDVAKNGAAVQEHNGSALQRTVAVDGSEDVMPFSIAQHIAQGRSLPGVTDRRNGVVLETVNGVQPLASGNLNVSFPINREVFNVIQTSRLTETKIKTAFVGNTSKACTSLYNATTTYINEYGFGTDSNCGNTTLFANRDLV